MYNYQFHEFSTDENLPLDRLRELFCRELNLSQGRIKGFKIIRQSLDTRKVNHPRWKYNLGFSSLEKLRDKKFLQDIPESGRQDTTTYHQFARDQRIAIIGSGPAGMFCGLGLGQKGYGVDVYEQGSKIEKRSGDIRKFVKQGVFNPRSNILFGEGGAGTYSDGKLTSRTKNIFTREFFKIMIECGAPPDIDYLAKPHIGTDKLQFIITALRKKTREFGVKYFFDTRVSEIVVENKKVTGVELPDGFKKYSTVICAPGISAGDLLVKLADRGVSMSPKGFSVGVRIEHPQHIINDNQLGPEINPKTTGAADYSLTYNKKMGRAYSFCMCPGGVVVPCADSDQGISTNGMSYHNRASAYANSALVVPVEVKDFLTADQLRSGKREDIFRGVALQKALEEKALKMAGGNFNFPAQTVKAFMENRLDDNLPESSFQGRLSPSNLNMLFEKQHCDVLKQALVDFNHKISGFIEQGLMIAPETRTSSAVRIDRHPKTFESLNTTGLFPLGEGSGHSGGIVSSAADGLKLASLVGSPEDK